MRHVLLEVYLRCNENTELIRDSLDTGRRKKGHLQKQGAIKVALVKELCLVWYGLISGYM